MINSQMQDFLKLTPSAIQHIHGIIEQRGSGIGFRLSLKKSGCNGYMYFPEIVDQPNDQDIEMNCTDAFKVFIKKDCLSIISGTCIDYVSKGLGQAQLVFKNPNVASECGCGESFNIKD